jgi:hypothetical protein
MNDHTNIKFSAECGASLVGIVTELQDGRPGIRILAGMRDFFFINAQAGFGTETAFCSVGTRPFFGDKAAGCEAHNSHPCSAEVKNEWTHISTSNTPSWHAHDKLMKFNV